MKEQSFPNRVVTAMLRSPFHSWVPGTMLVTVVGRKSGALYTLPVHYIHEAGCITVVSRRERVWWRNLRGGRALTLFLQGKDVKGEASLVEDERDVAAWLTHYLQQAPKRARHFRIALDENGRPNPDDLARAAHARVVIQITLGAQDSRNS